MAGGPLCACADGLMPEFTETTTAARKPPKLLMMRAGVPARGFFRKKFKDVVAENGHN